MIAIGNYTIEATEFQPGRYWYTMLILDTNLDKSLYVVGILRVNAAERLPQKRVSVKLDQIVN